jgi:hypothetical protein
MLELLGFFIASTGMAAGWLLNSAYQSYLASKRFQAELDERLTRATTTSVRATNFGLKLVKSLDDQTKKQKERN